MTTRLDNDIEGFIYLKLANICRGWTYRIDCLAEGFRVLLDDEHELRGEGCGADLLEAARAAVKAIESR